MKNIRKIILLTLSFVMIISLAVLFACGEGSSVELSTVDVKTEEITEGGEHLLVNVAYGTAPQNSSDYGFRVEGKNNFKKDYKATNIDANGNFSAFLSDLPDGEFEVRAYVGATTPSYGKTLTFEGVKNTLDSFSAGIKQIDGSIVTAQKLVLGKTCEINPVFLPENYRYRTVSYISSNQNVVEVASNGTVTAVGKGNATVTVTAKDGKTSVCFFQVEEEVQIALSHTRLTLFKGESMQIFATVSPDTVTDKSILWKSRDETIAKVDQYGVITALSGGEVFVEARSVANESVVKTCKVTVVGDYEIVINETSLVLEQGESFTLSAEVVPSVADASLTWSTSNPKIVTVNNGVVSAVGRGMAEITVEMRGIKAVCEVTVKDDVEVKFFVDGELYATRYTGATQGNKISMPENPLDATNSTAPYYFKGWYTSKSYTTEVTSNTTFSKSTSVYAKLDSIFSYTVKGGKATVTGFASGQERGDIVIPSKIGDSDVVAIASHAFENTDIETVTISAGIINIYDEAFRKCVSLDTVIFESRSTVEYIGDSAFRDCSALTSITLPNSLKSTGELMFFGCEQLYDKYGKLYQHNVARKEYFSPKYTYEFLGEDVLPIGGYVEPSVGYFAKGVTLEQVMKDFVDSGTNLLINISQARYGNTDTHYRQMYEYLEKYGGMMIDKTKWVDNDEKRFASYAGRHAEDEQGVVRWIDELYYYNQYNGLAKTQGGSYATAQKEWKKNNPRKLYFTNLLPINSPERAFVFGAVYYSANQDDNVYDENGKLTGKRHPLYEKYMSEYANYDTYYKTYIENTNPDVFIYDFYPMWANKDGNLSYPTLNAQHFEQLYATRYYAEDYNEQIYGYYVPFWNFLHLSELGGRSANYNELVWQINTAFVFGSKGYHYYCFNDYGGSAGSTAVNIDGTKNTYFYNIVQKANTQSQAYAKWLLNANVDHIAQFGENPNGETINSKMFDSRDPSMTWRLSGTSGKNHLVSFMKYYANNNEYEEGLTADVRELYFVCNNGTLSSNDGKITLNFNKKVTGSYIYNGVEHTFSGTSLSVTTKSGEGFAVLLDK